MDHTISGITSRLVLIRTFISSSPGLLDSSVNRVSYRVCRYIHEQRQSALLRSIQRPSLFSEPVERQFIALEKVLGLLPDFRMVVVHPLDLRLCQERRINQALSQGHHRHMFEAEIWLVSESVRRFHFLGNDHVCKQSAREVSFPFLCLSRLTFDTNTEFAVFVVPWLCSLVRQ